MELVERSGKERVGLVVGSRDSDRSREALLETRNGIKY